MIHGNTDGIRNSVLKELEELYKINVQNIVFVQRI